MGKKVRESDEMSIETIAKLAGTSVDTAAKIMAFFAHTTVSTIKFVGTGGHSDLFFVKEHKNNSKFK